MWKGLCNKEHEKAKANASSEPVGKRELDLPVESAGAEERRVERVGAVSSHDDLDIRVLLEAVHLVQKLEQNALHLAIGCITYPAYTLVVYESMSLSWKAGLDG